MVSGKWMRVGNFGNLGIRDYVVTVIDSTHVDLVGSSYAGFSGSLAKAIIHSNNPGNWAVPGTHAFFTGVVGPTVPFTVLDVTERDGSIHIQTDLTGGFPDIEVPSGLMSIYVHPAPKFTCVNCTGNPDVVDLSQAPPGAPLFSYSKRTYRGDTLLPYPNNIVGSHMLGKLVSVKMDVSAPYTGLRSVLTTTPYDRHLLNVASYSLIRHSPTINLKAAGVRTITSAFTSGAQIGDANLTIPASSGVYIATRGYSGPNTSANVSAESSAVWPTLTVEWITDQGFGVVPPSRITTSSTPTPPPPPPPPAPPTTTTIKAGDRIITTARLNVRAQACNSGKPGKQGIGKYGTVLIPSTPGCGYTWAKVNFDTGADGWVVQDYLRKVTTASASTDLSQALMPSIQSASSASALMQLEQQLQALLAQVQVLLSRMR
jgi:hypothetical protein